MASQLELKYEFSFSFNRLDAAVVATTIA